MNYQKPEITDVGTACDAITSTVKSPIGPIDSEDFPTSGAYEADE